MRKDLKEKFQNLINKKKKSKLEILKKRLLTKKNVLIIISFFIFLLFTFLLFKPVLKKSWHDFPLNLRAEIAFLKWQESYSYACFRDCLNERAWYQKILISAWESDLNYWENKIKGYDLMAWDNFMFLDFILAIKSIYNDFAPDFLFNLVYQESFLSEKQNIIIQNFPKSFETNMNLLSLISYQVLSESLSEEERVKSLRSMSSFLNQESAQFILSILLSNKRRSFKIPAIEVLESWSSNNNIVDENYLSNLYELLNDSRLDIDIRVRLIWLLSDYYNNHPALIANLLKAIYGNESIDNISRGFSALAINELLNKNLDLPYVSEKEWQIYYSLN